MVKPLKRAALYVSKGLTLQHWIANSRWRRERLAILCYHCVSLHDEHEWNPRFYTSPGLLEERFRMLREGGYNVLSLGEGIRRLYERTLPPKSVVITFDDGCYDFYHHAFPLLKKYDLPATVYLTTFHCYHPTPVFGMFCGYLLWKGRHNFSGGRLLNLDLGFEPDLSDEAGQMRANTAISEYVRARKLPLAAKDALAVDLARQLGVDYESAVNARILQLMTPEEVAQVAACGIDIQLHTHRHRTPNNRDLFTREIVDNRRCILEMIGSKAVHFCYPNGAHSRELLPWLEEQDVISATTCEPGLASPNDHPLLLPRITDTFGLSVIEFESWLTGASEAAKGRRAPSVA